MSPRHSGLATAALLAVLSCVPWIASCRPTEREAAGLEAAFRQLDEFVAAEMLDQKTPGLALALTDRERLLRVSTYGLANLEARTPVRPDHLFEIGSISKSFTAICLLQEREAGRFDPRSPISRYLPWFSVRTRYASITGHHLLTHTAGILRDRDDIPSSLYQAVAVRERDTGYPPGIHFAYSNVGYQILSYALEAIAGEPFPDLARKRILEPLGMTASETAITHAMRPRLAVGYTPLYDDRPWSTDQPLVPGTWIEYAAGDGSISATPEDLAAYLRMLLNRGRGPRGRILSEESFRMLIQRAIPMSEGAHYGYGLTVREVAGHTVIGHNGGMIGYSSSMLGDLDEGVGAVVFVNGPGDSERVARYALTLLKAAPHGPELPPPPPPDPPRVVRHAAEYAGSYVSPDGKTLTFVADGEKLLLARGERKIELGPRGDDSFYVSDADFQLFLLRFGRDKGAVVEAAYGPDWYAGERYTGPRQFRTPDEWKSYPGHYRTQHPWFSNFRIVLRKDKLWLASPEDDEVVLTPAGGPGLFRAGNERYTAEELRLDTVFNGQTLRANFSGVDYYRTFTP